MPMLVLQRLVLVFALMCFRQVQVQPDRDQDTRTDHPGGDRLVEALSRKRSFEVGQPVG